jgi:hypothetical protein
MINSNTYLAGSTVSITSNTKKLVGRTATVLLNTTWYYKAAGQYNNLLTDYNYRSAVLLGGVPPSLVAFKTASTFRAVIQIIGGEVVISTPLLCKGSGSKTIKPIPLIYKPIQSFGVTQRGISGGYNIRLNNNYVGNILAKYNNNYYNYNTNNTGIPPAVAYCYDLVNGWENPYQMAGIANYSFWS